MWWMLAASTAMNFLGAGMQLEADEAQYKANIKWQKYRNTMVHLSNAMNQNTITNNEIISNQAFADQALVIKKGSILGQARAEVAAAAAGVKGRSVNQTMFDIQRNAGIQEAQRQQSLKNSQLAFDQQRLNSAMSDKMQQDYTYFPKPNPAAYYLKAAESSFNSYMNMPSGSNGSGNSGGQSFANPNISGTNYLL